MPCHIPHVRTELLYFLPSIRLYTLNVLIKYAFLPYFYQVKYTDSGEWQYLCFQPAPVKKNLITYWEFFLFGRWTDWTNAVNCNISEYNLLCFIRHLLYLFAHCRVEIKIVLITAQWYLVFKAPSNIFISVF